MAFDIIYQLRTKKFWWLDTILYFTLTILIATVITYFIFNIKISFQEKKIQDLEGNIATTGIPQQKELERKVFEYQKKINDFSTLLAAHKIPSNLFKLIEESTLPNVWLSLFILNTKGPQLRLTGEAEDVLVLARQISVFKESKFVKDIEFLSLNLEEEGRIKFNLTIFLNPQIFTSLENLEETTSIGPPFSQSFLTGFK